MGGSYDPQVTLRMSSEIKEAAGRVMARKGITNLSDFIRQAVVAEIARLERDEALTLVTPEQVAMARRVLEAQAKQVVLPNAGQLGALHDLSAPGDSSPADKVAGPKPKN